MEKLPICRICLAENVRMYVVVNSNMRELYERLTDIPFVTQDCRPILACFLCCTKLKQCCRLMRKCLEAEELFAQMMNEDYETKPSLNQNNLEFGELVKTAIESISIVDVGPTESIVVKEELPAVCERLDDIIEPRKEHQSDDIKRENLDIGDSEEECVPSPPHHYDDSENDVPLMAFKTKTEEHQEVSKQKRRVVETISTTDAKKPKRHLRRTTLEDSVATDQNTLQSDSKIISNTGEGTSKSTDKFKKPNYQCDQCRRSFDKKYMWTRHIRTHTGDSPYKCDFCQRCFDQKASLVVHIRIHTGEKPFKCNICQHKFNIKSDLTRHILTHTGDKPYQCNFCQRKFNRKYRMTCHIRTHTGAKPYECHSCQRKFDIKSELISHIRTHTGEKPYKCNICQRGFRMKPSLKAHVRTHTSEKPYNCQSCGLNFITRHSLTCHIRTHTGLEPYKCDICQRSFNTNFSLKNHIRLHTGDKPYKCEICERCFTAKSQLTVHIRTHTGEKPYKCDICQRNFSVKAHLTSHIRIHTSDKP